MHDRHGDQGRDAVAFEIVKHGVRVEAPADDERGAERQAEREEGEAEAVEQGRRNEHRLAGPHRDMTDEGRPRADQSAQRRGPRRALRRAGGPRGQEHEARRRGGSVEDDRPARSARRASGALGSPSCQATTRRSPKPARSTASAYSSSWITTLGRFALEPPRRAGVPRSRCSGAAGRRRSASRRARASRKPRWLRHITASARSGPDAEVPAQPGRHGRGAAVELTVGERAPLIDQRRVVGMASRAQRHDGGRARGRRATERGPSGPCDQGEWDPAVEWWRASGAREARARRRSGGLGTSGSWASAAPRGARRVPAHPVPDPHRRLPRPAGDSRARLDGARPPRTDGLWPARRSLCTPGRRPRQRSTRARSERRGLGRSSSCGRAACRPS